MLSVALLAIWQAKQLYRARVTWKRAKQVPDNAWPKVPGSELGSSIYGLKLQQGFEFYYRHRYGYCPLWDSQANEYVVVTAQNKWKLWKICFQKRRNDVLRSAAPDQLVQIYFETMGDEFADLDQA